MTCPICKTSTTWEGNRARPFCSERCKLIDLGRWASGHYRIPGQSLSIASTDYAASSTTDPPDQTD